MTRSVRLPRTAPQQHAGRNARSGQAMFESFLVILFVSFLLYGLLQVAVVYNAREVLHHSAARAARARTVGFNSWMVEKAQRVAAIPNSGAMLEPVVAPPLPMLDPNRTLGENWDDALDTTHPLPRSERTLVESARIPEYLASDNRSRGAYILNYEEWERDSFEVEETGGSSGLGGGQSASTLRVTVRQRFPLEMPMHRGFYAPPVDADGVSRITLAGVSEVVEHFPLYLDDQNW